MEEEQEKEQVSEDSTEWESITYPHSQSHHLHFSQTHHRSSSDSQTQFIGRSTEASRDSLFTDDGVNRFVVFPPINHEGLHISSTLSPVLPNHDDEREESRNLPYLPSEDHRLGPTPRPPGALCEVGRLVRFGFELLRCKVAGIASSIRDFAAFGGMTNCSFSSATGVAVAVALLVWWLYVAVQRRRRRYLKVRKESRDHLILIIKEKDEKIKQLLHQIAEMNQILLGLHKDSLPGTR
ncbi:hypothetical protein U1Q18_005296 [Sarracenia purpurea var. burkii]